MIIPTIILCIALFIGLLMSVDIFSNIPETIREVFGKEKKPTPTQAFVAAANEDYEALLREKIEKAELENYLDSLSV